MMMSEKMLVYNKSDILGNENFLGSRVITFVPLLFWWLTNEDTFKSSRIKVTMTLSMTIDKGDTS